MTQKLPLLKQSVKTMKCLIYSNTCIVLTFFHAIQTLFDRVSGPSLFDVNVKKSKDRGDELGPSAFNQDLRRRKG